MVQLSERQQFGRAANALRNYFVRKLVVPKVYFGVSWSNERLEVIAIDRAGVGDVHLVKSVQHQRRHGKSAYIETTHTTLDAAEEIDALKLLHTLPAQYRYVAVIDGTGGNLDLNPSEGFRKNTFPEDGIGRVGELYVDVSSDEITVREIIKPERFRSTPEILALTDEYVAKNPPVDEYRDPFEYQASA